MWDTVAHAYVVGQNVASAWSDWLTAALFLGGLSVCALFVFVAGVAMLALLVAMYTVRQKTALPTMAPIEMHSLTIDTSGSDTPDESI